MRLFLWTRIGRRLPRQRQIRKQWERAAPFWKTKELRFSPSFFLSEIAESDPHICCVRFLDICRWGKESWETLPEQCLSSTVHIVMSLLFLYFVWKTKWTARPLKLKKWVVWFIAKPHTFKQIWFFFLWPRKVATICALQFRNQILRKYCVEFDLYTPIQLHNYEHVLFNTLIWWCSCH